MQAQCRIAPSLGALEGHPNDVWGTTDYVSRDEPTVFFGLYDLRDYIALWRHRGKAWTLWAGSDIVNLKAGFVFNDGKLKWLSNLLRGNWWVLPILKKAQHWVENEWEQNQLNDLNIPAHVCPSFMGNIDDYPISFKPGNKVYLSVSGDRWQEYGGQALIDLVKNHPYLEFHVYGYKSKSVFPNLFFHGRMPKEEMNKQIREMQCGLRLNETDGFSEITAKSVLWGQWPASYLFNPYIGALSTLSYLDGQKMPNVVARDYYRSFLNKFPWNSNI